MAERNLSGAEYRKRRADKEKEQAKHEHLLQTFLWVDPPKHDEEGTSKEMEVEIADFPTMSQGQTKTETTEVALIPSEMMHEEAGVLTALKDQLEMEVEVTDVPAVSQLGPPQAEAAEVPLSPVLEEPTEIVFGDTDVLTVLKDHPTIEDAEIHLPIVSHDQPSIEKLDVSIRTQVEVQSQEEHESAIQNLNFADPGTWAQFSSKHIDLVRQMLVEHGPEQVEQYNFPKNSFNRRFSKSHYTRTLANGEHMQRQWLQYSTSQDCVFCFCCKLFTIRQSATAFSDNGFDDWTNLSAALAKHERSTEHLDNFQKWKELEIRLKQKKTNDEEHLCLLKQEEKYWQQILERLISLVRVLGIENLAFRGTHEKLHTYGNGHFLKFVEFLSAFDPLMDEHLRRIGNHKTHVHYLGKEIQNELILLLSNNIRDQILASVRSAKYFSIILDCTPDVGHVEQMTMILRFVDIASDSDAVDGESVFIKEHFVGFIPLQETTGAAMTETILNQLKEMSLPIENMRGQGYDNGSNMKGKENGVQRRILNINPRALFVPCSAHSLNLVVNDAARCCLEAMTFFDIVQKMYDYFSGSTHHWNVLKSHVQHLTVKPLSGTRWESRIDALKPLRYQLGDIYDALTEIAGDTTLKGAHGNTSRAEAKGLAKAIHSFNFVVSLVVWHSILSEVHLTSKQLQVKGGDICDAIKQLEKTKKFLVDFRSDEGFEKALVDAREIAEESEVPPDFESEVIQVRRKKKKFSYEADDEPIQSPKDQFKVNFFFAVIDAAIQSVDERFTQLQQISSVFGFLYNIQSLHNRPSNEIMKHCLNLQQALQHKDSKDIDASDLCSELKAIARRVQTCASPQDVLAYVCKNKLIDSVPNIVIALRILLTLPVLVATGEGNFSKLKLIKTYISSSMMQERLVGLATLSIEHEIAQKLDLKKLVSKFAQLKAHKMRF